MKHIAFPITVIATFIGGQATAEGLTFGHVNLEYTDGQFPTSDPNATVLEGAVEYELNRFLLSADLRYQSFEGFPGSNFSVTGYELGAGYLITPEVLLGLGLLGRNSDFGETYGYEIYGQYRDDILGVAFNVEQPDTDNDFRRNAVMGLYAINDALSAGARVQWGSNSGIGGYTYQLNAEYVAGPIDLRAHYAGFSEFDAGTLGARGYYTFTDDIRGYASYQTNVGSDSSDRGFYLVGGGYRVAEMVWVDGTFGQGIGDDFGDFDRFTLTISFDTGTRQRLDDTFEQDLFDDRQDGIGLFPT